MSRSLRINKEKQKIMRLEFKDYTFEEAIKEFNKKDYAQPSENKIGVFTASDFNGTGEFRWLKDFEEVKYFMLNIWFSTLTDERDEAYYKYMLDVKEKLNFISNDNIKIIEIANDNPFDETEIKWIGTIDELIKDKSFFADQVKDHFNENQPINSENKSEFIDFLTNYVWA